MVEAKVDQAGPGQAEQDQFKSLYIWDRVFGLLSLCIWFAGIALVGYCTIALPIQYSSGQTTSISYLIEIVGAFDLHIWVSYSAAAAFGFLWNKERKLRKMAVRREHARVEKLEKEKDPNRTSSYLEE